MSYRLYRNKNGKQILEIIYDPLKGDWDDEILRARTELGLLNMRGITTLAFPENCRLLGKGGKHEY